MPNKLNPSYMDQIFEAMKENQVTCDMHLLNFSILKRNQVTSGTKCFERFGTVHMKTMEYSETSRNHPKQAKTSRNQPFIIAKPPKPPTSF